MTDPDPPPRRVPDHAPHDDAAIIAQSLEQPEVFARLYDRYAPDPLSPVAETGSPPGPASG
ncbi:hypothetical protein ABZU86_17530 [Streptomyces sp. NPDC005271]|uniref:hypothetical protein n=1 Tax=unclassified Streptomyces TaxID=2593676 RepID=UPI0033AF52F8